MGSVKGKDKWEGGVLAPDGCMYCLPLRAKSVLKIVPGGLPLRLAPETLQPATCFPQVALPSMFSRPIAYKYEDLNPRSPLSERDQKPHVIPHTMAACGLGLAAAGDLPLPQPTGKGKGAKRALDLQPHRAAAGSVSSQAPVAEAAPLKPPRAVQFGGSEAARVEAERIRDLKAKPVCYRSQDPRNKAKGVKMMEAKNSQQHKAQVAAQLKTWQIKDLETATAKHERYQRQC